MISTTEKSLNEARVERLMAEIFQLARSELIESLLHFGGPFKLDFTREYLLASSTEKLQHLLMAARLRSLSRYSIGSVDPLAGKD